MGGVQCRDLGFGFIADAGLDVAALVVGAVQLLGDLRRAQRVVGQEQLEAGVGAVEPPGGVQTRREAKGDGALGELGGIDSRDAHQSAQAGLGGPRERAQAAAHERAVLIDERHDVGDRGEGHEVEVLLQRARRGHERSRVGSRDTGPIAVRAHVTIPLPRALKCGGALERQGELEGDRRGAEIGARVAADRRMHDRRVGQHAVGARRVVVGDDDLDPQRPGRGDLGDGGDRAVDGDEQARAPRGESLDREQVQSVAVGGAVGQVPVDARAEPAQRAHEHGRGADPVDVVVTVDRDRLAGGDVPQDRLHRPLDAEERTGRMFEVGCEKRARTTRLGEPATHENLRERLADPQLALQPCDVARRAVGDLKAGPLHSPRVRPEHDGTSHDAWFVARSAR